MKTIYETMDGLQFEDVVEASQHEESLFTDWVNNGLPGVEIPGLDPQVIVGFFQEGGGVASDYDFVLQSLRNWFFTNYETRLKDWLNENSPGE